MSKIAGTLFFKVDGQQLSVISGIEVPMNTAVRDDVLGLDGTVHYSESHRAPYINATMMVPGDFPIDKITTADTMTITAEFANGKVYVLVNAHLNGEANYNPEDGSVDLEFHGEEGFFQ